MSGTNSSDAPASPRTEAAHDHVLGLTVYELPEPGQLMADAGTRRTRTGRLKLLLLFLVSLAPVVASYFTYYVIRPQTTRSFGQLIDPQRPLPDVQGTDLQGQHQPLPALKGQWLLVSVGPGACDGACQQQLYLQRQLREGLGKDRDRLDRVWLVEDDAPVSTTLQAAMHDATVLRVDPQALRQWLQPQEGSALEDHLYLVDPLGHWMMRFPPHLDVPGAERAKRDLERLLRASSSWDQPGRGTP